MLTCMRLNQRFRTRKRIWTGWTRSPEARLKMQDKASHPTMADLDAPVADHDVIFLGFPIWWYVAPHIINTFLEAYDFSAKIQLKNNDFSVSI